MKVLITGATGMIGQEIVRLCHQSKLEVNYLTTRRDKIINDQDYKGFFWNPEKDEIDLECFEDVEVIIHLVGASVANRWTKKYKKEIIESRIKTTNLLLESLKNKTHIVRQIISASAIGIYASSIQNYYTEEATEQEDEFIGDVVRKWEESVNEFNTLNIDVCILRIGLVLSQNGGAFPKIAKPIGYGVGTIFGNGNQWQSWIHVQDLTRMFVYVLEEELVGTYNAVAPNPVSNSKLVKAIANKRGKKVAMLNIPKFVLKLILGEMHMILFSSHRVSCDKITSTGFKFTYDNIAPAVETLVD